MRSAENSSFSSFSVKIPSSISSWRSLVLFLRAVLTISPVLWYPMYGTSEVALQRLFSSSIFVRSLFTFSPLIHDLFSVFIAFVRSFIDSKISNIISGHITFSSKWLL